MSKHQHTDNNKALNWVINLGLQEKGIVESVEKKLNLPNHLSN